ncbi:hypothetical protein SAMN05444004_1354 [Jannaschia faecimaris]|uniref:Uncharacterized protein n=1 Tax=Jannaschia faecimaris TaxID=1244108 RepID=A0A1H3UHY0_9RHOB|nr:hypothetical protein [Jannaschia faecimaris]SDZ61671.1 hypothetical protein SAMN05444004_1354 [Jannaschia faecimaris]
MSQAEAILLLVKLWGAAGALVALPFLAFGIDRVDEDARGAYVFRPLLVPGIVMVWPFVLWRWYVLATGRDAWPERYRPRRSNHRWVALAMPVAIVVIIGAGLSVRQTWPSDISPERLAPPPGEASQ